MSTEQPNEVALVAAALVAAQGELEPATFDSTNPFLRNRYASLGSVIHSSRPILAKHGLAILQKPITKEGNVCVTTSIIHTSGQSIDCGTLELTIGDEKGKSRAQVAGSIITYLRRYAWASVLGMYADEDTDGDATPPKTKRAEPAPEPEEPSFESAPSPHTTQAPRTPPTPLSEAPKGAPATKIGPKYRLQTLNRLKAAPGGENRNLFRDFALSKGWIKLGQEPEDWPFDKVPDSPAAFAALTEELQGFERTMREPEVAP